VLGVPRVPAAAQAHLLRGFLRSRVRSPSSISSPGPGAPRPHPLPRLVPCRPVRSPGVPFAPSSPSLCPPPPRGSAGQRPDCACASRGGGEFGRPWRAGAESGTWGERRSVEPVPPGDSPPAPEAAQPGACGRRPRAERLGARVLPPRLQRPLPETRSSAARAGRPIPRCRPVPCAATQRSFGKQRPGREAAGTCFVTVGYQGSPAVQLGRELPTTCLAPSLDRST
jgi:hypothetical protein